VPWPAGFTSPLVAIVDRATAADREVRYPDARAMLDELDAFIVAERAANKSDAPARRLAAWLADTWKEEREESAIDEAIEGSHLVSFLDDGGLDAVGTGTERSMAATAADEVPAPVPEVAPAPATSVPALPAAKRRWWIPVAALCVVAGTVAAIELTGRKATQAAIVATPDAARAVAEMPVDAELAAVTPDAALADAAVVAVAPPDAAPEPHHPIIHAHAITPPPPVAAETYRVTVTSKPWSYFTVDDAPLQHQTLEVIHLTAGPHVLHFARDKAKKDLAVTVPANDTLTVLEDMSH